MRFPVSTRICGICKACAAEWRQRYPQYSLARLVNSLGTDDKTLLIIEHQERSQSSPACGLPVALPCHLSCFQCAHNVDCQASIASSLLIFGDALKSGIAGGQSGEQSVRKLQQTLSEHRANFRSSGSGAAGSAQSAREICLPKQIQDCTTSAWLGPFLFQKCQPEMVMRSPSNTESYRCASLNLSLANLCMFFFFCNLSSLLTKLSVQRF